MKPATLGTWLESKYGTQIQPWECFLSVANTNGDSIGQFIPKSNYQMEYTYIKHSASRGIKERQPARILFVDSPGSYRGELGHGLRDQQWKIKDKVKVVNGVVDKADGTFLTGFYFNEIGDTLSFNFILENLH